LCRRLIEGGECYSDRDCDKQLSYSQTGGDTVGNAANVDASLIPLDTLRCMSVFSQFPITSPPEFWLQPQDTRCGGLCLVDLAELGESWD
jgi:hypothetical protein